MGTGTHREGAVAEVIALNELGRVAAKTEFGSVNLKNEQAKIARARRSDEREGMR